jgi:hypothetical protein
MGFNLKSIFSGGVKDVIDSVGNALDKTFTNDGERLAAKLDALKEANRALEAVQAAALKEYELEIQDRTNARLRESEFVKATGHTDYLMWFLAIAAMVIFSYMVWSVINARVQPENRELIFHIFGIVEGVLLSIFSYYFGSSAGSRIKDMKPKT